MKLRGLDLRGVIDMNNSRNRKERARLHNLALDETEAYKQDMLEDPEKYERVRRIMSSRRARSSEAWSIILATMNRETRGF